MGESSLIELDITPDMIEEAQEKSKEMGTLKNSITNGGGNLAGFLGEILANKILKGRISNTYQYDIVLEDGTTVDVKTKNTTVKPLMTYDCSIAAFNISQKCNLYCFVRIKNDLTKGWVLGVYDKKEYFKDAVFMKKGDVDPSNNFVVKSDCYNLKINSLKKIEEVVA